MEVGTKRLLHLPAGARAAVAVWLEVRGRAEGPLLFPVAKGGRLGRCRLTDQAVYAILVRRRTRASAGRFTPHDRRRPFVPHSLEAGEKSSPSRSSPATARPPPPVRPARRARAKRTAIEELHVPCRTRNLAILPVRQLEPVSQNWVEIAGCNPSAKALPVAVVLMSPAMMPIVKTSLDGVLRSSLHHCQPSSGAT